MARVPFRANLSALAFPFLSEFSGQSVVVKQIDQNFIASQISKDDLDKDIGIPQLIYCHNVIPTAQGYQSISFPTLISAISGVTNFAGVFSVVDSTTSSRAYVGYTAAGVFYYSLDPYYSWTLIGTFASLAGKQHTAAYINGITYVYFANVGCYKFNFTTHTLDSVTLTGLTAAEVLGIVSVQGYLLAWSKSAIAWSSLIDPTDFTPSLVTGAGGGSVQGAKGDIVCCVSHTIGLVIYTSQNAVAAPVSGNSRYPFNFRELVGSGGVASIDLITADANTGNHYAYTTSGMQLISLQQSQTIMPELTDFLAGKVFEDFDTTSHTFSVTSLSATMKKRMSLISDRYLVISYGINSFTHALLYDIVYKRWGKFREEHIEVFEFSLLAAEVVETPRRSIAFLTSSGEVKVVEIDTRDTEADGVVILGKYQQIRSRNFVLQEVTVENIPEFASQFQCADMWSMDGKNTTGIDAGYLQVNQGMLRRYAFRREAVNHTLYFRGAFHLVSLEVDGHVGARR